MKSTTGKQTGLSATASMKAFDKALEESYFATRYDVSLPGSMATIRIGIVCSELKQSLVITGTHAGRELFWVTC